MEGEGSGTERVAERKRSDGEGGRGSDRGERVMEGEGSDGAVR